MNNYINEYVRIINSIDINEDSKKELLNRLTEDSVRSKFDSKKQLAFASIAMIVLVVGIKAFAKNNHVR